MALRLCWKFGKLYFTRWYHGNDSAFLEETLVVPAVHIESGGGWKDASNGWEACVEKGESDGGIRWRSAIKHMSECWRPDGRKKKCISFNTPHERQILSPHGRVWMTMATVVVHQARIYVAVYPAMKYWNWCILRPAVPYTPLSFAHLNDNTHFAL